MTDQFIAKKNISMQKSAQKVYLIKIDCLPDSTKHANKARKIAAINN